ncbi:DMT family transporter [Actinomadura terrae]|uniref:DMT family transporter n=1 Tax=Actinomadura terrae TaxID=604353 RepID=UPI001FA7B127|nr:DMT family transporter [Actinomadura terrae]
MSARGTGPRGTGGGPVLAAVFVVMWSSGFIGAGIGTAAAGTETILMWRFIALAVLLLTWQFVIRRRRLTAREIGVQALLGLFSQSVYLFSMFKAVELGVTSGIASLIDALQPVCASAFAGLVLSERVSARQWGGLLVGLVGAGIVIDGDLDVREGVPAWAYAVPFAGMVALTVATIIERKADMKTSLSDSLAVQCAASAVFFSLVGLATGHAAVPTQARAWLAIVWLILLSTLGGYGLYWFILQRRGVAYVSSLIYLTAPATMIWGFAMFGDAISLLSGLGLLVCVAGVAIVHAHSGSPRRPCRRPDVGGGWRCGGAPFVRALRTVTSEGDRERDELR